MGALTGSRRSLRVLSPRYGMWALGCQLGRLFINAALRINQPSPTIFPLFSTGSHTMSAVPSTSTSHSNFASIFNAALEKYKRKTKQDLAKHPLLPRLQSCYSPETILTVLRAEFNQSQNSDDRLTRWVAPTVNVLYSFSATLGGVVGLVNISIFPYHIVQSHIYLLGIPTSKHNFHGDWRSSPGPCLSWFPCTTYSNTLTLRRLKMSALAETSLSTSLIASKDSSNGLKFTLASHRLRL
jgi:hypothetical protein